MADWLIYDIPRTVAGRAWKGRYRGQRQKWYAVRFTGKDAEINVESPGGGHKAEFVSWRWEPMEISQSDRPVQAPGLRARGEGIFQARG